MARGHGAPSRKAGGPLRGHSSRPGRAQRNEAARRGTARRSRARASSGILHRLPGAAGVLGNEADRARVGRVSHLRRHRLPYLFHPAPVQYRQHRTRLRPGARLELRHRTDVLRAHRHRHGRRRFLAQRPHVRDRQRRVQQERRHPRHHEERLHLGDRHAEHSFLAAPDRMEIRRHEHRAGAEGNRRRVDQAGVHLPRQRDGEDAARSDELRLQGAEGHHRRCRVPARTPAAYPPADRRSPQGRQARGAHALRRGRGRVLRGPFLHPPLGLPLALSRRNRAEPERFGPVRCATAQHRHRLAPAERRREVMTLPERPIAILIAALGGEGGGVLADWIIAAATARDYPVQSTSIPGVAQRTGATTYYVEIYPAKLSELGARRPVMTLTPAPCYVDVMVASELLEAGRAMQNGFVTRDRTTLIASTHRVYTVAEKMQMGDGRFDSDVVLKAARALAKRAILFDMQAQANAAGTVISAVMFGALAGSGTLPLPRADCEAAIRSGGKGAEASLRGFAAGLDAAAGSAPGKVMTPG